MLTIQIFWSSELLVTSKCELLFRLQLPTISSATSVDPLVVSFLYRTCYLHLLESQPFQLFIDGVMLKHSQRRVPIVLSGQETVTADDLNVLNTIESPRMHSTYMLVLQGPSSSGWVDIT